MQAENWTMIMQGDNTNKTLPQTILLYVVWLVFIAVQFMLLLWIHSLIVAIAFLSGGNAWVPRAADMWSMVILGMVMLATMFITESYLDKGFRLNQFWRRFGITSLAHAGVALALLLLDSFVL